MPLSATQPGNVTIKEHRPLSLEPRTPPARVVGEMVHKALQRWRFPGDPALEPLLRTKAQTEGLLDDDLLHQAVLEAENLLRRFQRHPLYSEMNDALERHHEVPFTSISTQGQAEWGFIDCLYKTQTGWVLVDFKTDELRDQQVLETAVEKYRLQMITYDHAGKSLTGETPQLLLCFLNYRMKVNPISIKP
jgi:ATP-dependent exoDNAse (exonuclease V) beta subunit